MDKSKFGMRLREARLARGMTMERLAEKLDLSYNYLSDMERGTKFPSVETLIRIVATLDISADFLLRDELPPNGPAADAAINSKLHNLTATQKVAVNEILDVIIRNLDNL